MTPDYPPEPWRLRGDLHASILLLPLSDVPAETPPGWRALRLGRYGVVCTAWVRYRRGGVLSYDELMSTLLVRRGWRVMPTITHIWVDSVASRDGGRELWGIPKELAAFACAGTSFSATDDGGPIATGVVTRFLGLPGRWPCRLRVVQALGGSSRVTAVRARARLTLSRATLDADPGGPLAYLRGRRPLISLSLRDFQMVFGNGGEAVDCWRSWRDGR